MRTTKWRGLLFASGRGQIVGLFFKKLSTNFANEAKKKRGKSLAAM